MASGVAFKVAATDNNPGGTSTLICGVAKPAAVSDGDFLIATIAIDGGNAVTITAMPGWTLLRRTDNANVFGMAIYYRQALVEPPTWGWVFSATGYHTVVVRSYTGADIFYPVDSEAAQSNASGTSQATPVLQTAASNTVLAISTVAAGNVTFTAPTGYTDRGSKSQNTVSVDTADTFLGANGLTTSVNTTLSSGAAGITHAICLKPSIVSSTIEQVRTGLKSLFPPGADLLYDWDNTSDPSELWKLTTGIATWLQQYGFAFIDLIRQEVNPLTLIAKLPDWEGVLGITQNTASAVNKWIATRQAAVLSKMRESGATTIGALRAVLEPLLGYSGGNLGTLVVYECNRAGLTAAHTYANTTGASIGSNSNTSQTVYVSDDGGVSAAGVQLQVTVTSTNPEQLSFVLTGPTSTQGQTAGTGQASVTWAAGILPVGSVTSTTFYLYEHATSAGKYITGNWTLQINTGAAACTLVSWSLFTEGGFARDAYGSSGLGADVFTFAIYADGNKTVNPDLTAASKAITRMEPGYSQGVLIQNASANPTTTQYPPFLPRAT